MANSLKHPSSMWVTTLNVLVKPYEHMYGDSPKKWPIESHLSRSLKVIGTDADRSGTYDFLLVIHSNHGSVTYRFQDIARHRPKIANFS